MKKQPRLKLPPNKDDPSQGQNLRLKRLLSLLGLAKKAGKLVLGMDAALEASQKDKAELLLLARDFSPRSRRKAEEETGGKAKLLDAPFTMDDISAALGRRSGIIAVCDRGFAGKINELLAVPPPEANQEKVWVLEASQPFREAEITEIIEETEEESYRYDD